jgi:hypothetical protein
MLTKTLGTRQRLPSTPAESLLRAEAIIADRRGPAPCSDSKAQGLCFQIQNPAELQRLAGLPHKSAILVMNNSSQPLLHVCRLLNYLHVDFDDIDIRMLIRIGE